MTDTGKKEIPYTAVVYVHGMGSQKRYEEISRLLDSLTTYVHKCRDRPHALNGFRVGSEKLRSKKDGGEISYIEVTYSGSDNSPPRVFRFYEVFWAPVTAGGVSITEVAIWMFKCTLMPIRSLLTPWRFRARLRTSYLHGLEREMTGNRKGDYSNKDFDRLYAYYKEFSTPSVWPEAPHGTFAEFCRFITSKDNVDEDIKKKSVSLAKKWLGSYRWAEIANLAVLATIALAIVVALVLLTKGVLAFLVYFSESANLIPDIGEFQEFLEPGWKNAWTIVAGLIAILGGKRFLEEYLGDVQLWSTYEETDEKHAKRKEIMATTTGVMRHVLMDKNVHGGCERMVVVSHSLGTTIAHDALLQLRRHNEAEKGSASPELLPLERLDHFVTIASPVDKIHYFFESQPNTGYRYKRVKEEIRGDLGCSPFVYEGKPHVHWVNIWDKADIISGPLDSPADSDGKALPVDNLEVSSLAFPDPAASHSAYFRNSKVLGYLFRVIFEGYASYWSPEKKDGHTDYLGFNLSKEGGGRSSTRLVQALMMILPWLGAVYLITELLGLDVSTNIGVVGLALLSGTVLAGFFRWFKERNRPHDLFDDGADGRNVQGG